MRQDKWREFIRAMNHLNRAQAIILGLMLTLAENDPWLKYLSGIQGRLDAASTQANTTLPSKTIEVLPAELESEMKPCLK